MSGIRRWATALIGAAMITLLIVTLFLAGGRMARDGQVQDCLDRGGEWDYFSETCDTTN